MVGRGVKVKNRQTSLMDVPLDQMPAFVLHYLHRWLGLAYHVLMHYFWYVPKKGSYIFSTADCTITFKAYFSNECFCGLTLKMSLSKVTTTQIDPNEYQTFNFLTGREFLKLSYKCIFSGNPISLTHTAQYTMAAFGNFCPKKYLIQISILCTKE